MSPKDIIIRNEPNTKNIAKSYERVNFGTDTKKKLDKNNKNDREIESFGKEIYI